MMSISNFFYKKKIIGYNPLRIDTKKRAILYYVTSWHGIYGMLNPYALGSSRGMAKIMAQTINSFGYIVEILKETKEELFEITIYILDFAMEEVVNISHITSVSYPVAALR